MTLVTSPNFRSLLDFSLKRDEEHQRALRIEIVREQGKVQAVQAVATGRLIAMAIELRTQIELYGSVNALPQSVKTMFCKDILFWADEAQKGGV